MADAHDLLALLDRRRRLDAAEVRLQLRVPEVRERRLLARDAPRRAVLAVELEVHLAARREVVALPVFAVLVRQPAAAAGRPARRGAEVEEQQERTRCRPSFEEASFEESAAVAASSAKRTRAASAPADPAPRAAARAASAADLSDFTAGRSHVRSSPARPAGFCRDVEARARARARHRPRGVSLPQRAGALLVVPPRAAARHARPRRGQPQAVVFAAALEDRRDRRGGRRRLRADALRRVRRLLRQPAHRSSTRCRTR